MRIVDVKTDDGVALAIRWFPAAAPRRGVVLAMHAMMVNGSTFDRPRGRGIASQLAARGIETFVLDFRGHGLSETPRRTWTLDDYVHLDLPAALRGIPALDHGRAHDVIWMGHSLGGLVSLAAMASGAAPVPRALILATTNIWRRPTLSQRAIVELFDGSARLLGKAPVRALRLGTDDEPASYTAHLARWARTGRFTSADGAVDYDAGLPALRLPILSIFGTGDPLCRPSGARELQARLGAAHYEEHVVPGATHFSIWRSPTLADEIAAFVARV